MKTLVLSCSLILLLAVVDGKRNCFTRPEMRDMMMVRSKMQCKKPHQQLVTIPAPKGYIRVTPSMVMAKRCEGKSCSGMNIGCMPKPGAIIKKNVSVELLTEQNMKVCATESIEEHTSCQCGCTITNSDCLENMVLNPTMCMCECSETIKMECEDTGMQAWRTDNCKCVETG